MKSLALLVSLDTALILGLYVLIGRVMVLLKRVIGDHEARLDRVETQLGIGGRR